PCHHDSSTVYPDIASAPEAGGPRWCTSGAADRNQRRVRVVSMSGCATTGRLRSAGIRSCWSAGQRLAAPRWDLQRAAGHGEGGDLVRGSRIAAIAAALALATASCAAPGGSAAGQPAGPATGHASAKGGQPSPGTPGPSSAPAPAQQAGWPERVLLRESGKE